MKPVLFFLSLCLLCSCNALYVSQNKTANNTPSIGVEWNTTSIANEELQRKVDSSLTAELVRFNEQKHAFTVHRKMPRDKEKDYISIDIEKGKVVGTGGKVAGYVVSTAGLIGAPATLIALQSPLIFGFYYFPQHNLTSKVTLSPSLSGEKRNFKTVTAMTGALFASTDKQVTKLVRKYSNMLHETLLNVETQISQH
jgi:hypothetical protein